MLLWNVVLALAWAALTSDYKFLNLVLGFMFGYFTLAILAVRGVIPSSGYVKKVVLVLNFVGFYLKELISSNLRVATDVLKRDIKVKPGIIAVPLSLDKDSEITLLAHLISLTPGSLSLDVSTDKSVLYIHVMHLDKDNIQRIKDEIKMKFEQKVIELL